MSLKRTTTPTSVLSVIRRAASQDNVHDWPISAYCLRRTADLLAMNCKIGMNFTREMIEFC